MSTLRTVNIIHPSGSTTNIVNDSSGNIIVGGGITSSSALNMGSSFKRNRILNGNMLVNQRGATISVGGYCTDRWLVAQGTTGAWTAAQSSSAPTGFTTSLVFTKTTGNSPAAGDANYIEQVIEGLNIADLGWGTANAKTITLSFWVYAGATGTFSGSLRNGAATLRSYPFTYTVSAANTWTNISITVAGDTTGTWNTDNTSGICVFFDIGSGTNYRGTVGAWATGNYTGATGATTYPTSTSGGTFYITGVQLEVGTKATPYEMQIYSDQLAQCQRYYETGNYIWRGYTVNGAYCGGSQRFSVAKRTAPTVTPTINAYVNFPATNGTINGTTIYEFDIVSIANGMGSSVYADSWTASAEL